MAENALLLVSVPPASSCQQPAIGAYQSLPLFSAVKVFYSPSCLVFLPNASAGGQLPRYSNLYTNSLFVLMCVVFVSQS